MGCRSGARMRRRDLLLMLTAGMMDARPVRAQQKAMPMIGYLGVGSPQSDNIPGRLGSFRRGLGEAGYVEGQNVRI